VLAFGVWRFVLSPTYWRVATFPQYQQDYSYGVFYDGMQPCVTGFCLREGKFSYVLREWRRGRAVWRVTSSQPDKRGWPRTDDKETSYAYAADVSPDGHVLAVMSAAGKSARVQSWRDGTLLGEVQIPARLTIPYLVPPKTRSNEMWEKAPYDRLIETLVRTCDDGRILLILGFVPANKTKRVSQIYLVRGSQLVAAGAVADSCWLAPDGKAAALLFTERFCRVTAVNGKLQIDSGQHFSQSCMAGTQAMAVINDGILRLNGKSTKRKEDWEPSEFCPSARYATLYRENHLRAVEVATDRYWQVDVRPDFEMRAGDPTEDGRHLVAYYQHKPNQLLLKLAERLSRFDPGLRERIEDRQSEIAYAALYRRPLRRLAAMRLDTDSYSSCWPSPDGRTFVVGTEKGCRLLRYVGL